MRHSKILVAAMAAGGIFGSPPTPLMLALYDYARERKFPQPETLARKGAELAGGDYPYASLAEAPERERVFFIAFRAVIEALEPFHQDDDPSEEMELQGARSKDLNEMAAMAAVGNSLMSIIETYSKEWPLKDWSPAADPAEIVGDLVNMLYSMPIAEIEQHRGKDPNGKQEDQLNDDKKPEDEKTDDDQVDEVERKRREMQAETDKVIAESGGKFSEPAPKKKNK